MLDKIAQSVGVDISKDTIDVHLHPAIGHSALSGHRYTVVNQCPRFSTASSRQSQPNSYVAIGSVGSVWLPKRFSGYFSQVTSFSRPAGVRAA